MSISRKMIYGCSVGIIVLLIGGGIALWSTVRLARTHFWVRHTEQVVAQIDEGLAVLVEAENAARGFALSGVPVYGADFERARARVPLILASLQKLTADNPAQQARVAALSRAVTHRLDLATELVAVRRTEGTDAAARFVATGRGRAATDHARALITEMQQEEQRLLAERLAADSAASRLAAVLVGGVALVAIVLVIIGGTLLVRAVTRPAEALARAAERLGAGELDVQVATGPDELGRVGEAFNQMARRRRDAVTELAGANAFLTTMMRASPLAIVAIDREGRCEAWNPAAERIFGWRADEVVGKPLPVIPPGEENAFAKLRWRVFEGHEVVSDVETRRVRKDGTLIDVVVSTGPRVGADGELLGMMAVIEDVTARKAAAEALHRAEERFRSLVAEVSDYAIFTLDPDGRIATWNRGAEAILGWRADEVVGRPLTAILPDDGVDEGMALLARARADGRAAADTWRAHKDGTRFWAHLVVTAVHDPTGALVGFTKITQDLSERRRAEEERARTLTEQALLADTATAMAATLDYAAAAQRIVAALVPRLCDIAMIDVADERGALHGLAVAGAVTVEPQTLTLLQRRMGAPLPIDGEHPGVQVIRTGRALRLGPRPPEDASTDELRGFRRALKPESMLVVPLIARGRIFGTLTLVSRTPARYDDRDLALGEELGRRAALALDNAHLYEEAQRAIAAREDLLAVVAHDLKNPLNAIALRAQLLARKAPEAEREQLALVRRAVTMMQHLINAQLDGASIDAGHFAINAEVTPMGPIVDDIMSLLAPLAADRELALDPCEHVEELIVWCDRQRVLQVLSNLAGNAIKFTPPGGRVAIDCDTFDDVVEITVRDDGPGIAPDELPHVFERFWRARGVRAAGSGLGLYIAKAIIEAHGGRMWVESTVGRGSAFHFTLPLAPPLAAATARA